MSFKIVQPNQTNNPRDMYTSLVTIAIAIATIGGIIERTPTVSMLYLLLA
jgi:hypothetical protein